MSLILMIGVSFIEVTEVDPNRDFGTINNSILDLNGLDYNWTGYVNSITQRYSGEEHYQFDTGTNYTVNETIYYGPIVSPSESHVMKDVNQANREFTENATWWGGQGHEWLWIFTNVSLNDSMFIAVFMEGDHNFTVVDSEVIDLHGSLYDCWVLTDSAGSIANYEKESGLLINGTFYFMGSNFIYMEMSYTNYNFSSNDNAPSLSSGQVDDYSNDTTHEFEFSVMYTDADNNFPSEINVVLNNSAYSLTKENISENNYTLGIKYVYKTYLLPGNYEFFFNASDGLYFARFPVASNITNLTVTDVNSNPPELAAGFHLPLESFNDSVVNFSVLYRDTDNNYPRSINVTLDDVLNYSMSPVNLSRNNYMEYVEYFASVPLDGGIHSYHFTCFDGVYFTHLPTSIDYPSFRVYNRTLENSTIGWLASHGEDSNSTHTQFLMMASNLGASSNSVYDPINSTNLVDYEILVANEGGTTYNQSELSTLETWIYNGGGLLVLGDNQDGGQVSLANHFDLGLSTLNGDNTDSNNLNFNHLLSDKVNVINFESNPENTINLGSSGPGWQWILNTSDGRIACVVKHVGEGKIVWISDEIFSNTHVDQDDNYQFANNTLTWLNLKKKYDLAPVLNESSLSPSTGNSTTVYTFNVTYSDGDGNGPIYVTIYINETAYTMVKVDPSDFNYLSGVQYQYSTLLQPGDYVHRFETSDGVNTTFLPVAANFSGPNISLVNMVPPSLTNGTLSPSSGYNFTLFQFDVNYTDIDNNFPQYVNVVINGSAFPMVQLDTLDQNAMDGLDFRYTTLLAPGNYSYYFETSDGSFTNRLPAASNYTGPQVEIPPLGGKVVGWIQSHGENSNSSYEDFLNGFTNLGANVTTITTTINITLLAQYDALILGEGGSTWTPDELDDLYLWVLQGGLIVILGDNADSSQVNVSARFDVFYDFGLKSSGYTTNIHAYHHAMESIPEIYLSLPISSIDLTNTTKRIVALCNSTANETIIATLELGAGRLFWLTDEIITDLYINYANNSQIASNLYDLVALNRTNNQSPILGNATRFPINGTQADQFTFEIDYLDVNNAAPESIVVLLNGTPYDLFRKDQVIWNYSTGVRYQGKLYLSPGSYNYSFNASNGLYSAVFPTNGSSLGPIEVTQENFNAPALDGLYIQSNVLASNQTVLINITYTDLDNDSPVVFQLAIKNYTYNFTKVDAGTNFTLGLVFSCIFTIESGWHDWQITVNDGNFTTSLSSNQTTRIKTISNDLLDTVIIGYVVTHGEFNWFQYTAWLDFAKDLGGSIEQIIVPLDTMDLSRYTAIIVTDQGSTWTGNELSSLSSWLNNGGTLLIVGDDSSSSITQTSNIFDVIHVFSSL
ncbi:MAG: hypothetical protein ACFFCS_22055, partial [Candidatus Hodarchaeota archaeon]